jgi:signal transduction histidine kinase
MKQILSRLALAFLAIIAAFALAMALYNQHNARDLAGEMLVAANEAQYGDADAQARYDELKQRLQATASGQDSLLLALVLSLACCAGFALYIYLAILRPFHRLQRFAERIAVGDYDRPLDMPRHNVFGAFSWAFDSMREGLKNAQAAERDARQANKLLIASISHDIKTPIASIRACAEALGSGQASSAERKSRYLDTIIRKSDDVARLTDDLFLHALADIDRLAIEPKPLAIRPFIASFIADYDFAAEDGIADGACPAGSGVPHTAIELVDEVPDIEVSADEKRLGEVFANIVDNAGKYAPGKPLRLSFKQADGQFYSIFSDQGTALAPEDLPFIFDKFYRGHNADGRQGSGLGLYIVRYLVQRMGGGAYAERRPDGLRVIVKLPIAP